MVECPFPKPGNLIETNNLRVVPQVLDELSRTFKMTVLYKIVQEKYNKKGRSSSRASISRGKVTGNES